MCVCVSLWRGIRQKLCITLIIPVSLSRSRRARAREHGMNFRKANHHVATYSSCFILLLLLLYSSAVLKAVKYIQTTERPSKLNSIYLLSLECKRKKEEGKKKKNSYLIVRHLYLWVFFVETDGYSQLLIKKKKYERSKRVRLVWMRTKQFRIYISEKVFYVRDFWLSYENFAYRRDLPSIWLLATLCVCVELISYKLRLSCSDLIDVYTNEWNLSLSYQI